MKYYEPHERKNKAWILKLELFYLAFFKSILARTPDKRLRKNQHSEKRKSESLNI